MNSFAWINALTYIFLFTAVRLFIDTTFTGELWLASDRLHQDGGCLVDLQPHHPLRPHRHPHLHGHPQAVSWNIKHLVPEYLKLHLQISYYWWFYFYLLNTIIIIIIVIVIISTSWPPSFKGETRRKRKRRVSLRRTVWEGFFFWYLYFIHRMQSENLLLIFITSDVLMLDAQIDWPPNEPTLKLLLILSGQW